jgi:DnaJ-class molecular chaperone
MKNLKSEDVPTEVKYSACDGTGFPKVAQPAEPGRKIYPPPCKHCLGKGRITPA